MASVSNISLCNLTETTSYDFRRYRYETEMSREALKKHGINAGYYVIAVILFYGTSVMLLIASYCNRKTKKIMEDKQIDSYLKEFQIVQESSSRDNYRNMKQGMVAKLGRMGMLKQEESIRNTTIFRCLSETLLPISAVAVPRTQNGSLMGNMIFNRGMPRDPIGETKITIVADELNPDIRCAQCRPNQTSANIKTHKLNGDCRQAMVHRKYWRGTHCQMSSTGILKKDPHGTLVKQILITGKAITHRVSSV